jgi:hypothetical protein
LANDIYGIEMKNATNEAGAKHFFMGVEDWQDRIDKESDNKYSRWNHGEFEDKGKDTVIKDESGKDARYVIYAVSKENYESTQIPTLCRSTLHQQKYMQTKKDWRNIEMTAWIYVGEIKEDDEITYYARSGKHGEGARRDTGDEDHENGCEGCALKAGIHYDGKLKYNKETHHGSDNQADVDAPPQLEGGIVGKWIGFKYILYNKNGDDNPVMEWWIDFLDSDEGNPESAGKPKNQWEKVFTKEDDGFGEGGECNGCPTSDVPITWGGPVATFRWDKVEKVYIKWASIREIIPPT